VKNVERIPDSFEIHEEVKIREHYYIDKPRTGITCYEIDHQLFLLACLSKKEAKYPTRIKYLCNINHKHNSYILNEQRNLELKFRVVTVDR
jgi:hypothetical protein